MAIGINWAEIWEPVWGQVWTSTPASLVPVPDVVGETQAAGTAILEGDLFAVTVVTVFDDTTAGIIIAQSPAAGVDAAEGSTVTITVSAGPRPDTSSEGSGGIWYEMEALRERARRRQKRKEDEDRETQEIQDQRDREIAKLLKKQEAKDDERAELARIQALADRYAGQAMKEGVPRSVATAVLKAHEERSRNALEQMQREIQKLLDEEEQAVISLLLMDD